MEERIWPRDPPQLQLSFQISSRSGAETDSALQTLHLGPMSHPACLFAGDTARFGLHTQKQNLEETQADS